MRTKSKVLSPFGKLVRKIRVDRDETQGMMASKLRITPSYLSSIEHGRCLVPQDLIPVLVKRYRLDRGMEKMLTEAAEKQQRHAKVHLDHCDEDVRQFVLKLADTVNRRCFVTKKNLDKILADLTC